MADPVVYPNVELGAGTIVEDGAIVGRPPRGSEPGDLPTRVGAGSVVRSGSVIYAGSTIGDGFQSGHNAVIRERNVIGDHCSVGSNTVLEPGNRIGSRTRIHSGCQLEFVKLGERCFVGPHVVFTDDPHPMCPRYEECVLGAVVEDDVSIGGNATIFPGVKIGAGAVIGAGSVVTWDVKPQTLVAGHPARFVKAVRDLECFKGYFERPYVWREHNQPV
jgi:acetyltransferase-like isoleucine patch superfamily enzyme